MGARRTRCRLRERPQRRPATGEAGDRRGGSGVVLAATAKAPPTRAGLGRRALRGVREEALEIAQPIAAIDARVDPVLAETPGVAPRADRVGMDAQHQCRARDGQRRIGRSRMELGDRGHRSPVEDL